MKNISLSVIIGYLCIVFGFLVGWVMNIITLIHWVSAHATLAEVTPMVALRVVGIFAAPLGGILGWF